MANPTEIRDSARRKANTHFTASEQRDAMVKKELEQERHAFDCAHRQAARAASCQGSRRCGGGGKARRVATAKTGQEEKSARCESALNHDLCRALPCGRQKSKKAPRGRRPVRESALL